LLGPDAVVEDPSVLVAVSDIHLQDVTLNGIPDDINVPTHAFEVFFQHVAASARHNRAREIIFLLNGDIFDFLRTERWFSDGFTARPYQWPLAPEAEARLLDIWDGIHQSNRRTMDLLHAVATGTDPFDFPVRPRFVYVAGNHDRLVNISPALRRRVREFLQINHTEEPFAWTFSAPEYGVFARHGHEYDWTNCEYNFRRPGAHDDVARYRQAPIGDWVTLDVATYLPHRFRELFADHPLFEHVYPRVRAIDDVRPATRVMPWIMGEVGDSREAAHMALETFRTVCRERRDDPFVWHWLRSHLRPVRVNRISLWVLGLKVLLPPALMLPDRFLRLFSRFMSRTKSAPAWPLAAREPVLRDGSPFQYVVSGHFHQPQTVLMRKTGDRPYIYFCTGSWRNRFDTCRQDGRFVKLHAMNYVTFFRADEDPDHLGRPKTTSFSLWDGMALKCLRE
jgi:UDP-2,3-diacylglucosamine pyrophosphatase LpxH